MSSSWRCPECETFNTGENCIVCGCPRPGKDKKLDFQGNTYDQGNSAQIQGHLKSQYSPRSEERR